MAKKCHQIKHDSFNNRLAQKFKFWSQLWSLSWGLTVNNRSEMMLIIFLRYYTSPKITCHEMGCYINLINKYWNFLHLLLQDISGRPGGRATLYQEFLPSLPFQEGNVESTFAADLTSESHFAFSLKTSLRRHSFSFPQRSQHEFWCWGGDGKRQNWEFFI